LELEKARKEAEAKEEEIKRTRNEAAAKAVEAEKARKETEAKTAELDKARKEAEAKTAELDRAQKDAQSKKLEMEMARMKMDDAMAQRKQLENELKDLQAKQTDRGIVLTLGDILFETGKSTLMPGARRTMNTIAEFLKKHPKRNILIEGFTDTVGSDSFNMNLSRKRAQAVRAALTVRGVLSERIATRGYGERFPLASNKTEAGRQQNRRVEVTILDEGVAARKMLR